jgi:DNA-binding NtrC family response regulator
MSDESPALQGARILLVDDTPANLDVLCALLEAQGCDLALALDGPLALKIAAELRPDLILLDIMMPGMDGLEVCHRLKQDAQLRPIPVIFISARDQLEDIVAGFRAGGVDYIAKPFRAEEVLIRVQTHLQLMLLRRELAEKNNALERKNWELAEKNNALEQEISQRQKLKGQLSVIAQQETQRWGLDGFVGRSSGLRRIFDDIRLLQENPATSVLIIGESGTGKELIARAIHFGSGRREGPFVPVNCASLPRELAESMLFGHVKGSFTGASADRIGYFEMAHEGTLFLDELGEMPLELQAKLLRVLEDSQVWRIGARTGRKVEVRVLAATNANLQRQIQEGQFRQDLYFRLARFTVTAPPLRELPEDIPLLARHFLQLFATEMGRESPALTPEAVDKLMSYPFPGNVRELKNIIERALLESRGGEVQPRHLHFMFQDNPFPGTPAVDRDERVTLEEHERRYIRKVLEETDWVIRGPKGAAVILGLPESTLRGRIKKLGIGTA